MAYWLMHPHAADTLEGIEAWWIRDRSLTAAALERALCWLTERGVVAVHQAADGRVRYCLANPEGAASRAS